MDVGLIPVLACQMSCRHCLCKKSIYGIPISYSKRVYIDVSLNTYLIQRYCWCQCMLTMREFTRATVIDTAFIKSKFMYMYFFEQY